MTSQQAPTAAVLIIGDEILSGRTQDVNLNAIARFLGTLGVDVKEARVVGDDEDEIVTAINVLRDRYDYLFTTGGIGPTHDDITADCVAKAFGVALYEHPERHHAVAHLHHGELNAARGRMCRVPEGGSLVRNPVNGPPGFQIGNVFVLAGVPQIMRGMLEDIGHRIEGGQVVIARTLRVDGSGEGALAAPLEATAKAHPDLSLGSYPFFSAEGYGSHLVIRGRNADEVETTILELTTALQAAGIDQIVEVDG